LVVPFHGDQFDNATRAVRLGVARVLDHRRYDASRAAKELSALVNERRYTERCATVSARLQEENGAVRGAQWIGSLLGRETRRRA
jgi:UDP:flavonoid glycosyltransferase YjiC (YdhE family)